MEERYDVWTSKEIAELFTKVWENTFVSQAPEKNTKTELSHSLNKKMGSINDQLAALKKAGLVTKGERAGQRVIYAPNVEELISSLNEKRLPIKYRLSNNEIKILANELKGAGKELLTLEKEKSNLLDVLENIAANLKSDIEFIKINRTPGIVISILGDRRTKLQNSIDNLPDEIFRKLEHLTVPRIIDKLLSKIKEILLRQ